MRYFVAGHVWLLVAFAMLVGMTRTNWQHHSRFFGMGPQLSDTGYLFAVVLVALFGVGHLYLGLQSDGKTSLFKPRSSTEAD